MSTDRTPSAPFPDHTRTGRAFITPCCTCGTHEFRIGDTLWLANTVAGHGWSQPWTGSIETINDTGTLVDADGTERRVWWRRDRETEEDQRTPLPRKPPATTEHAEKRLKLADCGTAASRRQQWEAAILR